MADQFSGLDTRANRTRKIVHMCDLQHACRFAHEKDCTLSMHFERFIIYRTYIYMYTLTIKNTNSNTYLWSYIYIVLVFFHNVCQQKTMHNDS